jgi:hypothetical protein
MTKAKKKHFEKLEQKISGYGNENGPRARRHQHGRCAGRGRMTCASEGLSSVRGYESEMEPSVLGSDLTGWRAGEPLF